MKVIVTEGNAIRANGALHREGATLELADADAAALLEAGKVAKVAAPAKEKKAAAE